MLGSWDGMSLFTSIRKNSLHPSFSTFLRRNWVTSITSSIFKYKSFFSSDSWVWETLCPFIRSSTGWFHSNQLEKKKRDVFAKILRDNRTQSCICCCLFHCLSSASVERLLRVPSPAAKRFQLDSCDSVRPECSMVCNSCGITTVSKQYKRDPFSVEPNQRVDKSKGNRRIWKILGIIDKSVHGGMVGYCWLKGNTRNGRSQEPRQ